jgi:hypothetical protein
MFPTVCLQGCSSLAFGLIDLLSKQKVGKLGRGKRKRKREKKKKKKNED